MATSAAMNRRFGLLGPRLRAALGGVALVGLAWGSLACTEAPAEPAAKTPAKPSKSAKPQAQLANDDDRAERYTQIRDQVQKDPKEAASGKAFERIRADLEAIANGAEDAHLRANAGLLLGSLLETRSDRKGAIAWYEHAVALVGNDAGPHMALALALAADGQFDEASKAQADATRLDPDNLENWLALGELKLRAGDEDGSKKAYAGYEIRRKGLIDGLTGQRESKYVVGPEERAGCALALAAAVDTGTAYALLYALETEPEASVRAAVAEVMGIHRLKAYDKRLTEHLAKETEPAVKEAMQWALKEIQREPVIIEKDARAQLPAEDPRSVPDGIKPPPAPAGEGASELGAGKTDGAGAAPGAAQAPDGGDPGEAPGGDPAKAAPDPGEAAGGGEAKPAGEPAPPAEQKQ